MEREKFKNALCDTVEVYASAIFIVGGLGLLAMYTAPIWLSILCLFNLVGPDNAMAASASFCSYDEHHVHVYKRNLDFKCDWITCSRSYKHSNSCSLYYRLDEKLTHYSG